MAFDSILSIGCALLLTTVALALTAGGGHAQPPEAKSFGVDATILFTPGHPINRFRPDHALGAGIDGGTVGDAELLTQANVAEMNSAGFRSLALRLRTELAIDAWHWNPSGRWSDPANAQRAIFCSWRSG